MQRQDDKIVIFDWGGVVESHKNEGFSLNDAKVELIRNFNKNISDEEIIKNWISKLPDGRELNEIKKNGDINEWYKIIKDIMKISCAYDEFSEKYIRTFLKVYYYKDVVEYAHSLKDKCKIGILSNLCVLDKTRIDKQMNLSKFDYVFLSYDLEMRKPNIEIYEYVLKETRIKPQNILFIDDKLRNVEVAKECGWNTCNAYGYELDKIKQAVNDFLK